MDRSTARSAGALIAIGGAEDKLDKRAILREVVEEAGGHSASLLVLATASELPETGPRYRELFRSLGARRVEVLKIATREDALAVDEEALELLDGATGIFITGGSQLRLASSLGGTQFAEEIRRRHTAGLVVAGTSAGASLLSEHMIAMGDGGSTPRRRLVHLAKGLGLAPNMIIDQHFRRRDRLGRLLTALSYNPEPLGVGIDEDTAAIIEGDVLRVVGSGAVTIVDASGMTFTNSYATTRGQAVAMLGLKLDVLTAGCRYDLVHRRGLSPATAATATVKVEETEELVAAPADAASFKLNGE